MAPGREAVAGCLEEALHWMQDRNHDGIQIPGASPCSDSIGRFVVDRPME
jgi:hypothetical protein